jgi:hypothetical protein
MEESGVDEGVVRKLAGGAFPVQVTAETMNRTPAIIARDFINDRLILAVKLALDKRRAATFSRPAAAPRMLSLRQLYSL